MSEDEFDAMEAYNNLLADYEYDIAVEDARENRAMQRLQAEKDEILRAKKKLQKTKMEAMDNQEAMDNDVVAVRKRRNRLNRANGLQ